MTDSLPEAAPASAQTYRLVVRALPSAKRQFVWEIILDERALCVQASTQTFRSLEDAYSAGQGALGYWRDKAVQAQVKAVQVPPGTQG